MGAKLQEIFDNSMQKLDVRTQGIMKVRLTVKMGIKPSEFLQVPDSQENMEKMQKSLKELGI